MMLVWVFIFCVFSLCDGSASMPKIGHKHLCRDFVTFEKLMMQARDENVVIVGVLSYNMTEDAGIPNLKIIRKTTPSFPKTNFFKGKVQFHQISSSDIMSLLIELPKDLFVEIWSEWLRHDYYCALDIAFCSKAQRKYYLQSMKGSELPCGGSDRRFYEWVLSRGLKLKSLLLDSAFCQNNYPVETFECIRTIRFILSGPFVSFRNPKVPLGHMQRAIDVVKACVSIKSLFCVIWLPLSVLLSEIIHNLPQLIAIKCVRCDELDNCLPMLNAHCRSLQTLECSLSESAEDPFVELLTNNPKMESLYIHGRSLPTLSNNDILLNIRRVRLSGDPAVQIDLFVTALIDLVERRPNLELFDCEVDCHQGDTMKYSSSKGVKSLHIYCNDYDLLHDLDKLLNVLANLNRVQLDFNDSTINQKFISAIVDNCASSLCCFYLSDGVTQPMLQRILEECTQLTDLYFLGPKKLGSDAEENDEDNKEEENNGEVEDDDDGFIVDDNDIDAWIKFFTDIPNKIEKLRIEFRTNGTMKRYVNIIKGCKHLKYFKLGHMKHDSELSKYKEELVKYNTEVAGGNLCGKINISEGSLYFIRGVYYSEDEEYLSDNDVLIDSEEKPTLVTDSLRGYKLMKSIKPYSDEEDSDEEDSDDF